MSIVIANLQEALKGESNAKRKYELYAEKAEQENLSQIAHLFRAVAFAEGIHIKNHKRALSVLKGSNVSLNDFVSIEEKKLQEHIGSTLENLKDAIEGETYETKKMYKKFQRNAASEGENVAELSFSLARDAEKIHADLFTDYYKNLKKGKEIVSKKIYVCQICGNVESNSPPELCPVCDHEKSFFKEIQ
ncbi:MAG: Rubrerythrin-2 [Promethearchaeota archaeon]|nr:MAG: Rubrerythrin-2 [Candidatus Lokiarchaeota archaeon]